MNFRCMFFHALHNFYKVPHTIHMLIRYIIYGLLGWNIEIIWTGFTSLANGSKNLMGHTSIWMFFIYGAAVFLFEPVHTWIANLHWFWRGCIWMLLIFFIELVSGLLLKLFGIQAWAYTGPTAVLGVIRLDYAPLWFAVGLIFEKIHHILLSYHIGMK